MPRGRRQMSAFGDAFGASHVSTHGGRIADNELRAFANGWVATGALAICAGSILITHRALPTWLGWWAVVAGVGSVLARAVWTEGYAMAPVAVFWVWTAALSVWLVRGGLDSRSGMV